MFGPGPSFHPGKLASERLVVVGKTLTDSGGAVLGIPRTRLRNALTSLVGARKRAYLEVNLHK